MNAQSTISRANVEQAEAMLRDVLTDDFGPAPESRADAKSLKRMLVHLVNINVAISCSTERHANAAKRLADFSVTTWRMAARNPNVADKLARLTQALRHASLRLKESVENAALAVTAPVVAAEALSA
jgi:hypothetical protein